MRQHLAASSQQQLPGILRPFVAETRIVAGKAVDARAPAQRSLAEDKVPRWIRIEILHGDTQQRICIHVQAPAQKRQNIGREKLPLVCIRVMARGDAARCNVERWKNGHLESEKGSGEHLQSFERRAASRDE